MGKHDGDAAEQTSSHHEQDADNNVDKIREILFGGQMRDYDQRFVRLEQTLAEQYRRMGEDINRRFGKLEEFARQELANLGERLASERKERMQNRDEGKEQIVELKRSVETWLTELEERTAVSSREMRATMHDQYAELAELLAQAREQLESNLAREAQILQDRKVSREDLAELLSEVAMRLNRQFDLPQD